MLGKLLTFDPAERITSEAAVRHPYVQESVQRLHAERCDPPARPVPMDDEFELLVGKDLLDALAKEVEQPWHKKAPPSASTPETGAVPAMTDPATCPGRVTRAAAKAAAAAAQSASSSDTEREEGSSERRRYSHESTDMECEFGESVAIY